MNVNLLCLTPTIVQQNGVTGFFFPFLFLWLESLAFIIFLIMAYIEAKIADSMAEIKSFVMNNKAFGNLLCNSQNSFHTSLGSSDSNNIGYRSFFKLNIGICIYKKS